MGRPASDAEGGLANSVCNPQGRRGPNRERGKHGDDARFCTPFCASPGSAFVARRLGAARARLLRRRCAASTDPRRGRRRWRTGAFALGASRAALFAGADRSSTPRRSRSSPFDRNDSLGFWQLPGPWADVFRFDPPGAAIALIIYAGGSILALIGGFRGLRLIEALSLIAVPFLFNLMLAIGADWHMAELGAAVTAHANLPFPAQVAIGRALTPLVHRRGDPRF